MTSTSTVLAGAGLAHGAHVVVGAMPVVAALALWSALVAEERRDDARAPARITSAPTNTPPRPRPEPDPARERWMGLLTAVALLDIGSAVIHVAVAGEHFDESGLFGTFFLVVAAAQLAAAVWLVIRRSRSAVVAIGALNLTLVVIWTISRTVGVPFGPEPGVAEAIGAPDAVATAYEVLIAAAAVAALARAPDLRRPVRLVTRNPFPPLTAWAVAAFTATALPLAR